MPIVSSRCSMHVLLAILVVAVARPALAGPPLLCFPFDIGTATSLPWDGSHGWKGMRADYDLSHLATDAVTLLAPSTPVVVRMETLRRAALYATLDETAARTLAAALMARARAAGDGAKPNALALFDAGYLVETLKQTAPIAAGTSAVVAGVDGYAMVRASLSASGNDPAIEFAAALMTSDPARRASHDDHVRRARAGVPADSLLARNVGHLSR